MSQLSQMRPPVGRALVVQVGSAHSAGGSRRPPVFHVWLLDQRGAETRIGSHSGALTGDVDPETFWRALNVELARLVTAPQRAGLVSGAARNLLAAVTRRGRESRADETAAASEVQNFIEGTLSALHSSRPQKDGMAPDLSHLAATAERARWHPSPPPDDSQRITNVYDMDVYRHFPGLGVVSQSLQRECVARGLATQRVAPDLFSATDRRGGRMFFSLAINESSSTVSGRLTSNKQLTRRLLEDAGVPAPDGRVFPIGEVDHALQYAESLGWPVVVKPRDGKGGVGVVTAIADPSGFRWGVENITALLPQARRFIVEQHLEGQDYRIHVAHGEVLSVVLRTPACVIGDGVRSVSELVVQKNLMRRRNPHARSRLITPDGVADALLRNEGLDWNHVPEIGQRVRLAAAANISRGGDSTEVLPETHPSILQAALKAVAAIPGLDQAGVDFLLADHRLSVGEQAAGVCEINATPALMANAAPLYGRPQPVVERLVELTALNGDVFLGIRRDRVSMEVRAEGLRDVAGFHKWLCRLTAELPFGRLNIQVESKSVLALVEGPVMLVTGLIASMSAGPPRQRPESVHARHAQDVNGSAQALSEVDSL